MVATLPLPGAGRTTGRPSDCTYEEISGTQYANSRRGSPSAWANVSRSADRPALAPSLPTTRLTASAWPSLDRSRPRRKAKGTQANDVSAAIRATSAAAAAPTAPATSADARKNRVNAPADRTGLRDRRCPAVARRHRRSIASTRPIRTTNEQISCSRITRPGQAARAEDQDRIRRAAVAAGVRGRGVGEDERRHLQDGGVGVGQRCQPSLRRRLEVPGGEREQQMRQQGEGRGRGQFTDAEQDAVIGDP